ncbi:NAD-dependent epimerase/dehydratase family protein [Halonatronum saccharophilum]|uniref:NAD-dependent epimerase/dehydratase family protein n=1 Tax=Halonatronum saccharophilum TaxID=150060 RepID=UPI00047FBB3F|nr:NAD-dependent epimerase/dehydratase family protein [Halonatronum saccharophilum]
MKILVMGGTEFVSRAMAMHLIERGYQVDIFTRGRREVDYKGVRDHIKGDRRSLESLREGLSGRSYDGVFDITAYNKEDLRLLTSVLERDKLKRYIFCSSMTVYKEKEGVISDDSPRGFNPNWGNYGLDKMRAEDYLFKLCEEEGLAVTIFRPAYIYGEGNNLYREGYFFDRIEEGLSIPIPARDTINHFIHIEDLVKLFESALYSSEAVGRGYSLSYPQKVTWEYLVESAIEAVGKEVEVKRIDYDKLGLHPREFFPFRDITHLLSVESLGEDGLYTPQINLQEGLERAYRWYSDKRPKLDDPRMDKVEYVLES